MGFWIPDSGNRVSGFELRLRIPGFGIRVRILVFGFGVDVFWFFSFGLGFRDSDLMFRFWDPGFGFRVSNCGIRNSGFEFRYSSFEFRDCGADCARTANSGLLPMCAFARATYLQSYSPQIVSSSNKTIQSSAVIYTYSFRVVL